MSSRVRASNNEWMSGLERTVSGILATWSEEEVKGRCCTLFSLDAEGLYSMPLDKLVRSWQGFSREERGKY